MLQALLFLSGTLLWLQSFAQPNWQLIKDRNGIKVYAAASDSSKLKKVKTVATIDGNIEKLIAVFRDIDGQKQWVFGTRRTYTIKKSSDNEILYYVETALPWPMQNRDTPIMMKINENKNGDAVIITTVGEPNAIPVNKGKVRVKHFYGKWDIKQTSNNKLSIDYYLDVDPSGSIPAWIINSFISKGPYETLVKLSGLLK